MQNLQKISSYLGFATRANKIIFGIDRITVRNKVPVIVMGADAEKNTSKKIKAYSEKTSSPLVVLDGMTLEEILKKNNCKVVAVLDPNLAQAIIDNAI